MLNPGNAKGLLARFLAYDSVRSDPVRTEEDRAVWDELLKMLQDMWRSHTSSFHKEYMSGLDLLSISRSQIPSLSNINDILSRIGWSAVYVDKMVDDRLYQEMQAARVFPVARHIRRKRDILHSASPDFIHDVIGHLPMLFSVEYRSLVNDWAQRALEASPDAYDIEVSKALLALIDERDKDSLSPAAIAEKTAALKELHHQPSASPSRAACLSRFYAWAIEFGVTSADHGDIRIGGSAALSSPEEFKRIITGETRLLSFTNYAIASPVNYAAVQDLFLSPETFLNIEKS
jgi:phenylalanine-4-hydroxylase